ncbi:MAG: hypothetical protein ABIT71_18385 [Vicinamibacteraceae bacterium]
MWADEARWFLLPWALLAALVAGGLLLLQPDRRRIDLFSPTAFAAWSHVLPAYVGGAIVLALGFRPPVLRLLNIPDDAFVDTIAYALLGFVSLGVGFAAPFAGAVGRALGARLPSRDWQPEAALVPALLLLGVGTIAALQALDTGLMGYQVAADVGPFDAALVISSLVATSLAFAILGVIACSPAHPAVRAVAASALVARAGADMLFTGRRGALLQYALIVAAAYACSGRRIRLRHVASLSLAFAATVITGLAYGSTFRALKGGESVVGLAATAGTVDLAARQTLSRGVGGTAGYVRDRFVERLEIISNAAVVVANYRRLEPFERAYGLDDNITTSFVGAFVPRLLWPDKPPASDPRAFADLYYGFRNAFAVTPTADLLRNYGPFGVPIGMAALGLLLRVIYATLIEGQRLVMWRVAAYITVLTTVSYEGFFGSIVPMLVRTIGLSALCLIGVAMLTRLMPGGRARAGTPPTG